jgi:hypothetical protein
MPQFETQTSFLTQPLIKYTPNGNLWHIRKQRAQVSRIRPLAAEGVRQLFHDLIAERTDRAPPVARRLHDEILKGDWRKKLILLAY